MGRYLKKHTRIGSLGPTEERGFALWAGYELENVDDDLSEYGLIRVDDWPEDRIAAHGVTSFTRVDPEQLGIRRTE